MSPPDALWAPWRMEFIDAPKRSDCIFCTFPAEDRDAENLILGRSRHSFVIFNRFPYNNGHLMVIPRRHGADFAGLPREEADDLLRRRSGDEDAPRMLGAFNEATPDWLSFFMFTYFTDRDGKMQLAALAQSGFDPLSRSCRFMLTEEAHHLFVGETGVGRTIEATCNAMKAAGITDPYDKAAIRKLGVVDLPTLQKKANFHMSVTRDLFGSEISSNGAEAFSSGLKGRFNESGLKDDHQLENTTYPVMRVVDGILNRISNDIAKG